MMMMLVEESWSNYFLGESLIIINFPANRQSVGVSQKVKTLGRRLFVAISVSKFVQIFCEIEVFFVKVSSPIWFHEKAT